MLMLLEIFVKFKIASKHMTRLMTFNGKFTSSFLQNNDTCHGSCFLVRVNLNRTL